MTSSLLEIQTRALALNNPDVPYRYIADGNTISGVWKADDSMWTQRFADSEASPNFSFTVRLNAEKGTFKWFESDSGYNNGRIRAYRGYNRGFSINIATIILHLVRKAKRAKAREGRPEQHFPVSALKRPLLDLLAADCWKSRGVTI